MGYSNIRLSHHISTLKYISWQCVGVLNYKKLEAVLQCFIAAFKLFSCMKFLLLSVAKPTQQIILIDLL